MDAESATRTKKVDYVTGAKHTLMMRSGEQRGGGVRPGTNSLRGGDQQQQRSRNDDEHCGRDENRSTGSLRGGGRTKLRIEEFQEPGQDVTDQFMTSSRGGGKSKLRIGSVNVRTVRGKMDLIIDMMEHHQMDVLAVQETRLKKELETAAKSWAGRRGYSMTAEKCTTSRTGSDDGGVFIFSKFPVQPAHDVLYKGRVVAVRATRERNPPLLIVCVYGHASNPGQAKQLQCDLFQERTGMGEDYVPRDWNRTVEEGPMSTFTAKATVRYGDEPWQHDLEL